LIFFVCADAMPEVREESITNVMDEVTALPSSRVWFHSNCSLSDSSLRDTYIMIQAAIRSQGQSMYQQRQMDPTVHSLVSRLPLDDVTTAVICTTGGTAHSLSNSPEPVITVTKARPVRDVAMRVEAAARCVAAQCKNLKGILLLMEHGTEFATELVKHCHVPVTYFRGSVNMARLGDISKLIVRVGLHNLATYTAANMREEMYIRATTERWVQGISSPMLESDYIEDSLVGLGHLDVMRPPEGPRPKLTPMTEEEEAASCLEVQQPMLHLLTQPGVSRDAVLEKDPTYTVARYKSSDGTKRLASMHLTGAGRFISAARSAPTSVHYEIAYRDMLEAIAACARQSTSEKDVEIRNEVDNGDDVDMVDTTGQNTTK